MAGYVEKAPASHAHVWITKETLLTTHGVPFDVERVTCRDCGKVRRQKTKRLHA